ncbi:MAG: universal stress protein [Nitrososphaeraceae archaeon]
MEKKLSKILVPIDGSHASFDAADYAIMLAKQHNSQLILLHVLHPIEYYSSLQFFEVKQPQDSSVLIEQAKKEANKWFDDIKKKIGENTLKKPIKIHNTIIVSTTTIDSILDYAEDKEVDLIVIGTRGRSRIKKLLLGSTASGVVTYSSCPVTVVK